MKKIIFYTIFCLAVFILIPQNTNAQECEYGGTCLAFCVSRLNPSCCCYNPQVQGCSGWEMHTCYGYYGQDCNKPTCSSSPGCTATAGWYTFDNIGLTYCEANGCRYYNGHAECGSVGWMGCVQSGEHCGTDVCIGSDYYDYYCSGGNCTYSISYDDPLCCECTSTTVGGCCDGCDYCPAGKVFNGTSCVDATATLKCSSTVNNCTAGQCSGQKRYPECNGSGSCDTSATSYYTSETVYASAGKVFTSTCTDQDATSESLACDDNTDYNCAEGGEYCVGNYRYSECKPDHTCDNYAENYYYQVDVTASAGKILNSNCENRDATAFMKCASTVYRCTAGQCSGQKRYPECNGSGACDSGANNYYAYETIYASAGTSFTLTCGESSITYCDSTWRASSGTGDNHYGQGGPYNCQGMCNGSGSCLYAANCEDVCTRYDPGVSIAPSSQSGSPGDLKSYTVTIINYDASGCGSSLFNLNVSSCPSGWTCSLSSNSITISPDGSSGAVGLDVTSSGGATADDYTISVTATNSGATSYFGTGSATYTVVEDCDCTGWTIQSCGYPGCDNYHMARTRTCTPSGCFEEQECFCDESCCSAWVDQGCGPTGGCAETEMYQTRDCGTCSYSESRCISDPACGGVVTINPPIVTTNPADNITETSATLYGILNDMGEAASCLVWFEWGLTPVMGNKTPEQTKASTGSFWADLSGLTANTTYYFEAFAKNGGSW